MAKEILRYKHQRTLVLVKPEGVRRGLVGEIVGRIEHSELKIVGLGILLATRRQIDGHYPKDSKWIKRLGERTLSTCQKYGVDPKRYLDTIDSAKIGRMVRGWIIDSMTSGPIVKMVIEGPHAIEAVRKLAGNTIPYLAGAGTIRGDFSNDSPIIANLEKRAMANMIHASETPQEAAHEIHYWFKSNELLR